MNHDNFKALADRIELEDRFNLTWWAARLDSRGRARDTTLDELLYDCGTVGCVAGWAATFIGGLDFSGRMLDSFAAVEEWLGISGEQAACLFYAHRDSVWAKLADQFDWSISHLGGMVYPGEITATQAAKVLRMIAAGEVEL